MLEKAVGILASLMFWGVVIFQWEQTRRMNRERRELGHRFPAWVLAVFVLGAALALVGGIWLSRTINE